MSERMPSEPPSRWQAKLRAALIHLAGSLVVAALVAVLVFSIWYPGAYRDLAGGAALFVILVGVDVVLGPVLTFVVFDAAKRRPELLRDLGVVLTLQVCALGYGIWAMAQARPTHLVWEMDQFRVVRANDIVPGELSQAPPGLGRTPWTGPDLVGVSRPPPAEMPEAVFREMEGQPLAAMPRYWTPFDAARSSVLRRGRPLSALVFPDPGDSLRVERAMARLAHPQKDELRGVPLVAARRPGVVFVDAAGTPVLIVALQAPLP